jgi:sensor histidine kinase YesM
MKMASSRADRTVLWPSAKAWVVIVASAILMGIADAVQRVPILLALGVPVSWTMLLVRQLTFWLTFAAFIPVVLWFTSRFRLEWPLQPRIILVHLLGGFSFVTLQLAVASFVDPLRLATGGDFRLLFFEWVRRHSSLDFLAYFALVSGYHTIHYYRESRARGIAAAEARLEALRSQLNPHFLFNTLNTISGLALTGRYGGVVDMLTRLSDLLRLSLDEDCPHEVPLVVELQTLEHYLAIQRIRFEDRLSIRQQIDPETLNALVPCMILQPLMENAVVHGCARQGFSSTIVLRTSRQNGTLRLTVSDTGPGFSHVATQSRRGIGLRNTQARLEQLYGSAQRLECGDAPGGGAVVTVSVPFRVFDAAEERTA